jgi:hypothetical protein
MRSLILRGIWLAVFSLGFPAVAHAQYLDPGSSSILIQVLLGGVVGVAAFFKLYWHRLRGLVGGSRKSPRDDA